MTETSFLSVEPSRGAHTVEAKRASDRSGVRGDDGAHELEQRSEEHTSELQSPCNLVCRLLLKKKKNFTRLQFAIQNRCASNIDISQSTFSVKVLNLFSRSRRKTNKRKSKHSAMLRNKETRHRMFIGLLNTTRKLA